MGVPGKVPHPTYKGNCRCGPEIKLSFEALPPVCMTATYSQKILLHAQSTCTTLCVHLLAAMHGQRFPLTACTLIARDPFSAPNVRAN